LTVSRLRLDAVQLSGAVPTGMDSASNRSAHVSDHVSRTPVRDGRRTPGLHAADHVRRSGGDGTSGIGRRRGVHGVTSPPDPAAKVPTGTRRLLAHAFTLIEDVVYIGLGALLALSALVLLGHTAVAFAQDLAHAAAPGAIVGLLDRLLLVL